MEKPVIPVIVALVMLAAVKLATAQQPPFPATGGTVEVEYANRIFQLGQRPELLEFARMFRETVCINLTMPVENPETFREGSNYKINCLPWLMNFPGGSITWYQSLINATTGVRGTTSVINPESPPASVVVRGPFNSELFITSTIVSPAQELTTSAIYTCEVCIGRGKSRTLLELREDGQCHNASVVTFNIGSPPVVDDTVPEDLTFVPEGGIRNYRVGSSPCLSNPPDITPPAQGVPSPDPEAELRIRCDLANAQLTDTSEFPPATPGPITRRWYFNGVLIYEAVLESAPVPTPEFLAMFPSLNPDNNLILFANQGWVTIVTAIEGLFVNRTDISFDAVFGNWTCSLTNPLGTDVARFGTILRQCGAPPILPVKGPDNTVEVVSGGTVTIGCNGCVLTPPDDPVVTIDCTPESGDPPFFYTWFRREGGNDTVLEGETDSQLTVTEDGQFVCEVRTLDITLPATATTIIRRIQELTLTTTIENRFGEILTDNGCSRLRGSPSQVTTTDCTFIGDTLSLVCSSANEAALVVIVTPDGSSINGTGEVTFSTLIDQNSGGQYRCSISDDVCSTLGDTLEVGVYEPATIDRAIALPGCDFGAGRVIREQVPALPATVTLCCPFFGINDPDTTWRVIRPDSRGFPVEMLIDGSDPRLDISSRTIDSRNALVLTITDFDVTDEGTYVCRSKNNAGVDAGIVALRTQADAAIWVTTNFSECDPPCQRGIRTRVVTCVSSRSGKRLPQILCLAMDRPADTTTEGCTGLGACFLAPRWRFTPWSKCSKGCSGGFRRRTVQCVIPRTQEVVRPSRCIGQRRPSSFEFCLNTCCTRDQYPAACRRYGTRQCNDPRYQQNCCWTCGLTRIP